MHLKVCSGFIFSSATAAALAPFKHAAGAASAMYGFLQMGISGLITFMVYWIQVQNSAQLGLTLFVLGVGSICAQIKFKQEVELLAT